MKNRFDAVGWMRARRETIDEEDQKLSWEEKHEKTRRLLEKDPLWLRLRNRVVEPKGLAYAAVMESKGQYISKKSE
jgi:hypothetical protein